MATFTSPLQVVGASGITSLAGYGSYRGVLEFAPGTFSGLTVVNAVGVDDYVQGVVPAESPASWPLEALKAQAIAARTYAITRATAARSTSTPTRARRSTAASRWRRRRPTRR